MNDEQPLTVGSLFSGIGGIDLGLERAGMQVAWQCEVDPWCRGILAKHWPETPCYGDIRTIDEHAPRVDVLAGGFPCQPVSLAGKGLAQQDERWLWPEFARLIRVLRPRYVIAENVPGLLARGLDIVLADLAALRFDAEWTVFGARDVGAPHKRDRVWIVAWDTDTNADGAGRARLAEPHSGEGWVEGREGQRRDRHDADGLRLDVADAEGVPVGAGLRPHEPRRIGRRRPSDSSSPSRDVADPSSARPQGLWGEHELPPRPVRPEPANGRAWPPEPDVGRVAHGVPQRVDRLRSLGNAVVPACAEHIGRLVMGMHAQG